MSSDGRRHEEHIRFFLRPIGRQAFRGYEEQLGRIGAERSIRQQL